MFGSLDRHPAAFVEAFAPRTSGDLMEIASAENSRLLAIILAEPGKQHRADGDIDTHAKSVGAADNLEQALLRQLLHQDPIFGQEAGVVNANPMLQPFTNLRSVGAGEFKSLHSVAQSGFFFTSANINAGETLRALRRFQLGEMH